MSKWHTFSVIMLRAGWYFVRVSAIITDVEGDSFSCILRGFSLHLTRLKRMLVKSEIRRGLRTEFIGRKLFLFDLIDSTNDCARMLAEAGVEEGAVVIAEEQTQGKGRQGRRWEAERGANLLFSILLRPEFLQGRSGLLTLAAAVATAEAVERSGPFRVEAKWPNDLLIGGKKFTGILIETSIVQDRLAYAIVGIGINVNQRRFPDDLSARATSLALLAGSEFDRTALLCAVLSAFESLYQDVREGRPGRVLADWKRRSPMLGRDVELQTPSGPVRGKALDLNADGALIVDINGNPSVCYAGEVTAIPPVSTNT